MNLSFNGTGETYLSVDPAEFAGMSREQIAAELHSLAMSKAVMDYRYEDFVAAAEQVLAQSGTVRSEGVRL